MYNNIISIKSSGKILNLNLHSNAYSTSMGKNVSLLIFSKIFKKNAKYISLWLAWKDLFLGFSALWLNPHGQENYYNKDTLKCDGQLISDRLRS